MNNKFTNVNYTVFSLLIPVLTVQIIKFYLFSDFLWQLSDIIFYIEDLTGFQFNN